MPSPKNIKEYIGDLYKEPPAEVISKIRVDLEPFIGKIIKSDSHELYLVGRKSRHLFHPLITSRLVEQSPGIHFLNVLMGIKNGSRVCIIDSPGRVPKEISLLADSIDEGEEKEVLVNILKKYDCNISKIFCYVANQQGIDYLVAKNVFTRDQIIALHTIPKAEYRLFNNRLETYYQSRIEPMDIDHAFDIYSFATKISSEDLFLFFKTAVQEALKCGKGDFSEAEKLTEKDVANNILFVPDEIKNFNFDCYDFSGCNAFCKAMVPRLLTGAEVEYVQIRLKAELKDTESTICLMVFCPLNPQSFSLETIKANKCLGSPSCPVQDVAYDNTRFTQDEIMDIKCPQCIENRLSGAILQKVMGKLKFLINGDKMQ
ncbi:MAG: hypothetical protein ACM3UY_10790 [Methanocella sp.]